MGGGGWKAHFIPSHPNCTLPCCREFANDTHSLICKSHHLWLGILQDQTVS